MSGLSFFTPGSCDPFQIRQLSCRQNCSGDSAVPRKRIPRRQQVDKTLRQTLKRPFVGSGIFLSHVLRQTVLHLRVRRVPKGIKTQFNVRRRFPLLFHRMPPCACSAARQVGTATFRRPHRAVSQIMSFIQSKEYPVPVPQAGDPIKINGRWLLTMRDGATRIQWLADHGATSFPLGVSATGRSIIAATAGVKSI